MVGTLYNGVSGIKTHQFGIDSISNNIANVNTNGYRQNIPEFTSVFAKSLDYVNASSSISNDYNYGSTTASNAVDMSQGSYVNADGSDFNLALTGTGWFVIGENQEGTFDLSSTQIQQGQQNYFTRDGSFSLDGDAYLVNSAGQYLYGVDLGKIDDNQDFLLTQDIAVDMQNLTSTELTPLKIPQEISAVPTLTDTANLAVNLSREDGLTSVADVFKTADGEFDEAAFRANNFNTLYNSAGQSMELRNDPTLHISVQKEGEEEPTDYSFTYGEDFTTVGEFVDAIENQTGMSVSINANNTCVIAFSNETGSDMEVTFSSEDTLLDRLGLSNAPMKLESGNEGSVITTNQLSVPTYTTNLNVYDEQGERYYLETTFWLTDYGTNNDDTWGVSAVIKTTDGELQISDAPSTGVLAFDSDGNPTYTGDNTVNFDQETIAFNPAGTETQQTTNRLYYDSSVVDKDVNGNSPGQLESVSVDENGIIYLHFTNNIAEPMGRVGLADFVNDQGLRKVGENKFEMVQYTVNGAVTTISGPPLVVWDEETGYLKQGTVLQGKLETSNVDITTALTELIIMQRAYSANAKSFTTGDEMAQEAIGLKR